MTDVSDLLKECLIRVFQRDDIAFALSTGTPGPFRKMTTMIMESEGNVLGYAKIGETPLATARIKHEANTLKDLGLRIKGQESWAKDYRVKIRIPECLYEGSIGNSYLLIQSPSPFEGKCGSSDFNEDYAQALRVLTKNTAIKKKFAESEFYRKLKQGIENYPLSYRPILRSALSHLENNIGNAEITFALSHGDFAPWNMLWKNKNVYLYDWESACLEAPIGFDLVHFLFYTGWLIRGKRRERLYDYIKGNDKKGFHAYKLLRENVGDVLCEPKILVLLYLIKISIENDKDDLLGRDAKIHREILRIVLDN